MVLAPSSATKPVQANSLSDALVPLLLISVRTELMRLMILALMLVWSCMPPNDGSWDDPHPTVRKALAVSLLPVFRGSLVIARGCRFCSTYCGRGSGLPKGRQSR